MNKKDSIEHFLYWNSPAGLPLDHFWIGVGFEVGGAYEDWGWIIKRNDKVYACHKNLETCLKMARDRYAEESIK